MKPPERLPPSRGDVAFASAVGLFDIGVTFANHRNGLLGDMRLPVVALVLVGTAALIVRRGRPVLALTV